jgi:nucleoside-diphosphate-sugar epimerase
MFELDADATLYDLDDPRSIDHLTEPRPDSLYGVSKLFGEALGRYHVERNGLECVCLRIGTVLAGADPADGGDGSDGPWAGMEPARQRRLRATWLSHRDCADLVHRALVAPCRWAVVYGTSANHRRLWDLEHAREAIGYEPRDTAPAWLGEGPDRRGANP